MAGKRSALIAFSFALDDHGRRHAPVRIPHKHLKRLAPSPSVGGTREPNGAATTPLADHDTARPGQPSLVFTPGVDSCSKPASVAAMHNTPTPRTTRVTRTAHGDGARPHRSWFLVALKLRLHAVCVPSPP
eukprot:1453820-Pleurochrysis_carterae.AAC.2